MEQIEKERNIKRERDAAFAAESAQTRMITLCKVVQMRETVSTAPRSTLLLHLDKVMLETACVRVRVCVRVSVDARWRVGARGARACIWRACSLFPTRVREPESVLAGSSVCLLARV